MRTFNLRIFALFFFVILSWGLAWPINKLGLEYMTPLWYTATRLIVATGAMFALVISIKKFTIPQKQDIPLILVIGLLQIAIYILLANIGLAYLPAGRSALLAYTTPLWVMPIATLAFKERPNVFKWLGFVLSMAGLFILMSPQELNWHDTHVLLGTGALLFASFCWALSMLGIRYMQWNKSPLELIPWQLLIGTLPIVALAWYKEPSITYTLNHQLVLSLLYTGILVTGLSYWCGVIINRELPPIVVSVGFLMVPVFSFISSAYMLQESISYTTMLAITLILVGLICVVVETKPVAQLEPAS